MSRITITDIAKMAGVSVNTVYKALNGKSKISEDVRNKILYIAKECGYVKNRNAQAMSRKQLKIGILLIAQPEEFQNFVISGCKDAASFYSDFNFEFTIKIYQSTDEWQVIREELQVFIDKNMDGIVIESGYQTKEYRDLLDLAAEKGIAIFTLVSDMEGIGCKGSVTVNAEVVGRMAAQVLTMNIKKSAPVAILAGNKNLPLHQSYIAGFQEVAKESGISVLGIYETFEDYQTAFDLTEKILEESPGVGGIYVTSYNSVAVCNALKKHKQCGKIPVVGQDLYEALIECLKDQSLTATIFQNPYRQGYRVVELLTSYLEGNREINYFEKITPQLVMTSNLDCYLVRTE